MTGKDVDPGLINKAADERVSHLSRRSAYKSKRFGGSLAALRTSNHKNLKASMILKHSRATLASNATVAESLATITTGH